jgi:hypothetical protein
MKNEKYLNIFFENNGLANFFFIIENHKENLVLVELILNTFVDLSDQSIFKKFTISDENYIRAFWNLIELFEQNENLLNKIFTCLANVIAGIDERFEFSLKLGKYIEKIQKK